MRFYLIGFLLPYKLVYRRMIETSPATLPKTRSSRRVKKSSQEREHVLNDTTFQKNMSLAIHRWFRYSAGFSAEWAGAVIKEEMAHGRSHVLDPFVGSGTILLEAEKAGVKSIGIETHPLIARIAEAKLLWNEDPSELIEMGDKILSLSERRHGKHIDFPDLINRCYSPENLAELAALRETISKLKDDSGTWKLAWLALVSILRTCSFVGTAQWQYVLPNKTKARVAKPTVAFKQKIKQMAEDMELFQSYVKKNSAKLITGDARTCKGVKDGWADLIITSPPYINNYDYADATRLEMMFMGEIDNWKDLQKTVRERLIPSCTQQVGAVVSDTKKYLEDPLLKPIHDEIVDRCSRMDVERHKHGGKKNYHTMVAAYFLEMAKTWV